MPDELIQGINNNFMNNKNITYHQLYTIYYPLSEKQKNLLSKETQNFIINLNLERNLKILQLELKVKEALLLSQEKIEHNYWVKELATAVDFYLPKRNLIIQVDNPSHYYRNSEKENASTKLNSFLIKKLGCNLLRLNYNNTNSKNLNHLVDWLLENINKSSLIKQEIVPEVQIKQEHVEAQTSANNEIKPESSSAKKRHEPKAKQEHDDVSSSVRTKSSRKKKELVVDNAQEQNTWSGWFKQSLYELANLLLNRIQTYAIIISALFKNNNDSSAAINQDKNSDISFRSNNEINLNKNDKPKFSWRERVEKEVLSK